VLTALKPGAFFLFVCSASSNLSEFQYLTNTHVFSPEIERMFLINGSNCTSVNVVTKLRTMLPGFGQQLGRRFFSLPFGFSIFSRLLDTGTMNVTTHFNPVQK
jgi:hypothetical protein